MPKDRFPVDAPISEQLRQARLAEAENTPDSGVVADLPANVAADAMPGDRFPVDAPISEQVKRAQVAHAGNTPHDGLASLPASVTPDPIPAAADQQPESDKLYDNLSPSEYQQQANADRKAFNEKFEAEKKKRDEKWLAEKNFSHPSTDAPTAMSVGIPSYVSEMEFDDVEKAPYESSIFSPDDELQVEAYQGERKKESDKIILPSGHVLEIKDNPPNPKTITLPTTQGLSHNEVMEVARGMVAAAISEGILKKNKKLKIDTPDFRLRAAIEAQVKALGYEFEPADPKLVEEERRNYNRGRDWKFSVNSGGVSSYDILIDDIKKTTVEDNARYSDLVEKDPDILKAEAAILKKQQQIDKLKRDIAEKAPFYERELSKLEVKRNDPTHNSDVRDALKNIVPEAQEKIKWLEKEIKDIEKGVAHPKAGEEQITSLRKLRKAKYAEAKNNPEQLRNGFYNKYLAGVSGEAPDPVVINMRKRRLDAKSNPRFQIAMPFIQGKSAEGDFVRNYKRHYANELDAKMTLSDSDFADLGPNGRVAEVFDEVVTNGIYRASNDQREPLQKALANNDPAAMIKAALALGDNRSQIAQSKAQEVKQTTPAQDTTGLDSVSPRARS